MKIPGNRKRRSGKDAVVVESDLVTAYGHGIDCCWGSLLSGASAVTDVSRFNTDAFQAGIAATISGLGYLKRDSLVMQMLKMLFHDKAAGIPADSRLLLASTKGEIDLLEKYFLQQKGDPARSALSQLLKRTISLTGVRGRGEVVSAACASATTAIARAASIVHSGSEDSVLVVACDSVTEFVFAGFSSLMAIDREPARPFDRDRGGLSLGEAAAFVLVMSEERAKKEKRRVYGKILGWGMSDDANHMTGPSRTGAGLSLAIEKAIDKAGINEREIGLVSAHGTGTVYNDAMEIKAFNKVFNGKKIPVYSVKGALGHTMGAAGLVEFIVAMKALKEKRVPPTVSLRNVDDDARGWASKRSRKIPENKKGLVTNAGFSGINAALVMSC